MPPSLLVPSPPPDNSSLIAPTLTGRVTNNSSMTETRKGTGAQRVRPRQAAAGDTVDVTSNPQARTARRRTHFDPNARIYLVPTISELTPEERDRIWITPQDEEESRDSVVSNVVVMRNFIKEGYSPGEILTNGLDDDNSTICFRGLEHMITAGHSKKKKIRRRLVTNAVLDEQDRQDSVGIKDDVLLAEASSDASAYARRMALDLAARDARYIVNCVRPTMRRSCSSATNSSSSRADRRSRQQRPTSRPTASSGKYSRPQASDDEVLPEDDHNGSARVVPSSSPHSSIVTTDSDEISVEIAESSNSSKRLHASRMASKRGNKDPRRRSKSLDNINLLGDSDEMKDDVASVLSSFAKARLSNMLGRPTPPSSLGDHQQHRLRRQSAAGTSVGSATGSPRRRAAQTA